jgi:hypothetical protein
MKPILKTSRNKYFDFKIGIAGGLVMGIVIFCVNYFETYNLTGSITAALKQGVYTFLFGGSIMKLCENIALNVKNSWQAVSLAILVPSAISILLTYGVHSLKGTPLPLESTIPTAIFVIPSTLIWALMKRKKLKI